MEKIYETLAIKIDEFGNFIKEIKDIEIVGRVVFETHDLHDNQVNEEMQTL